MGTRAFQTKTVRRRVQSVSTRSKLEALAVFMLDPLSASVRRTWAINVSSSGYASRSSSSIKTGTRCIMRLVELSYIVRLERRTTDYCSSRRSIRLVPVFILDEQRDA